jgi:Kef-type K+ transport system membrane component KefB
MTPANAPMREQEYFYDYSSSSRFSREYHSPRWLWGSVMTSVWALAALWLGLALVASLLSIWLRISTALSEIVVGTIAQLIIGAMIGQAMLGTDESWIKFLSGIGAIVLTFLAGAELDPAVFRLKWREAAAVGLASFLCPFLGCAAAA